MNKKGITIEGGDDMCFDLILDLYIHWK